MRFSSVTKILELFGHATSSKSQDWKTIVREQHCPFLDRKCLKVRKSNPNQSIGSCSVVYGKQNQPILICPARLTEYRQIFTDCLHLLTNHEPGNELHIIPEITIPGGSVDYFIVSASENKVCDFVGVELQTLDTTGTIWPIRQNLLETLGVHHEGDEAIASKTFGMNWKMTAKTILVQLHHKIHTFEHINKKLVLVMQDCLLDYMRRTFNFAHVQSSAKLGEPMHFHVYGLERKGDGHHRIVLDSRLSTDAEGIDTCLGLQADTHVEFTQIVAALERKMSRTTLFAPV